MVNDLKKFFDQRGSVAFLFLLLVLPIAIGGTGYFMCLEQKTSLESAFEREADGILHNLEKLAQYHISSFDWPPIEELQQRTISNPTISMVWIEDLLSHRHFGEQKRVQNENEKFYTRTIDDNGKIIGRVNLIVDRKELNGMLIRTRNFTIAVVFIITLICLGIFYLGIKLRATAERTRFRHQEQLAHVTRIATMGEMATGIAHELNQPLAAIAAFIDGSLRRLSSGEPASEAVLVALEKASKQTIRAGDVIQRLRDFVGGTDAHLDDIDINDAIQPAIQLMKMELDLNQISLSLDVVRTALRVSGDVILIQQVILNLIRNSVDALKSKPQKDGEIIITTAYENHFVSINISDNGPGIDTQIQENMFEAYISTKKTGLGLGLPICKSIIEKHCGQIWYETAPTEGALFCIRLPVVG
jgi:signal transduction histidine kinase